MQLTKCTDFNNSKVAFVTKKYADWTSKRRINPQQIGKKMRLNSPLLNRTILDINEEEKWEYASSPKADKIEEAESTSS